MKIHLTEERRSSLSVDVPVLWAGANKKEKARGAPAPISLCCLTVATT